MHPTTVLVAAGLPAGAAAIAQRYLFFLLPAFPSLFVYESLRKALQAHGVVQPLLWVAAASNVVS